MDFNSQGSPSLPFPKTGFEQHLGELQVAKRYTVVWLAIMCMDHLATLDSEFFNVWKSKLTLFKVFFLLNRYGSLVLVAIASAFTLAQIPSDVCSRIAWISPMSGIFTVLVCDIIMSLRIDAIYGKSKPIRYLLAFAVISETAAMIAMSTRLDALVLPPIAVLVSGFDGCTVAAKDPSEAGVITAVFWSAPLVVATLFLGLVLYRSGTAMRGCPRMPLYERLIVGQLKYFVAIAVTHVANVALITQRNNPTLQTINIIASIVLTSVCSSHLVLGLYDSNEVTTIHSTRTVTTLETWGSPRKRARARGGSNEGVGELVLLTDVPFTNLQRSD